MFTCMRLGGMMRGSVLVPPSSAVSELSTTTSRCAPTGVFKSHSGTTWLFISVIGLPFVYPLRILHNHIDAVSASLLSLYNLLLDASLIPIALMALHMNCPTKPLFPTTTANDQILHQFR